MPVQERDYLKSGADASSPGAPGWLARLNEIGERHATAIIAASTLLIILTVLLFAKGAYDRSQVERAEQDLAKANSVEVLEGLKAKYAGTPVAARIVYKLANRLADEGKLDAAVAEYEHFLKEWPLDPFKPQVDTALVAVKRNRDFNDERKPVRLKEALLQSHPRHFPGLKDPRLQFGPERRPNPTVDVSTPSGAVRIELFENEAPLAVAAFLKLAEAKHYDGLKWEEADGRLRTSKKPDAAETKVPDEDTSSLSAEAGSLLFSNGQVEILTRAQPGLKDATIIGVVREGLDRLKKDEAIGSIKAAAAPEKK